MVSLRADLLFCSNYNILKFYTFLRQVVIINNFAKTPDFRFWQKSGGIMAEMSLMLAEKKLRIRQPLPPKGERN